MLPQFLYPLLMYRSMVFPFLVLSGITVPSWLLFRLYRRRTPGHRRSFNRELLLLTFVVYLSGLAAATLEPNRSSRLRTDAKAQIDLHPNLASLACSSASLPRGSAARAFCVRNGAGNVVLFFPLGILIPTVWRRLPMWKAMLAGIALSSSIELVQYVTWPWGHRLADINDVILNSLGACLGLALAFLLRVRRGTGHVVPRA